MQFKLCLAARRAMIPALTLAAFAALSAVASATEKDPYPEVRESMIAMSRQLGVTCVHCHDANNFKSTAKPAWRVAKQHMRIVEVLNGEHGFGGKPKADCYMCHRGAAAYPYREKLGTAPHSEKPAAHEHGH